MDGRGLLVTFEGPEGGGKSTLVNRLMAALEDAGHQVLATREPGGTPTAERVRGVLIGGGPGEEMADRCELLLMLAARADHTEKVIRPALEAGRVVLCDRYVDSSVAYQGSARGLDRSLIDQLNRFATGGLFPDLTLLLDVEPEVGLGRARRKGTDRIEDEGLEFHGRVRRAFLELAEAEPERFRVLDGGRPLEEVYAEARDLLLERLAPAGTGP